MDRFIPHHHAGGHHQHLGHEPGHDDHDRPRARRADGAPSAAAPARSSGALSLHRIPEGLAIGAGFAVPGASQIGIMLAIAVGVQNVCEGMVMSAPLRQGGISARPGAS